MNYFTLLFLLLAVICTAFAGPADVELHPLSRTRRQAEFIGNSKRLIEELIENLSNAAQKARESIATFNSGIQAQASKYLTKFQGDLAQLRDRLSTTIQTVSERFGNTGAAVKECMETSGSKSESIFQEAVDNTRNCAEERLREGRDLVAGLSGIPDEIREFATAVFAEMRNCSQQNNGNIIGAASCLGTVTVRAEVKAAGLLAQSGLSIARVNLYVSTLPAALEVCAGSGLMGAGMSTARLIVEVGSCSASSISTIFSGTTASPADGLALF